VGHPEARSSGFTMRKFALLANRTGLYTKLDEEEAKSLSYRGKAIFLGRHTSQLLAH
jgi:hypothetical protein